MFNNILTIFYIHFETIGQNDVLGWDFRENECATANFKPTENLIPL